MITFSKEKRAQRFTFGSRERPVGSLREELGVNNLICSLPRSPFPSFETQGQQTLTRDVLELCRDVQDSLGVLKAWALKSLSQKVCAHSLSPYTHMLQSEHAFPK